MKILFTSHRFSPDIGGIEVNSEILASYFSSREHKVRLVTQSVDDGARTFPFEIFRKPAARQLIALHRWADVVYQNNIELGSLWPVLFTRKPTVISVRTWIRANDGRVRPVDHLKKWVLSRAGAVIAISEAIRRDSFKGAVVIGNPYRSGLFRALPDIGRANSVAFLGRFVSDKGADLLIRAFAEVKEQSSGLTLIGSGPEEQELRRLAESLGVHAHFAGVLQGEKLVRELNKHEILVVPSRWPEPFGNVALEGMACGCVVIGSDGGGLPDAIGSGGLLFKGGDVAGLAGRMRSILLDPDLGDRLRAQAPAHLARHHETNVGAAYLKILLRAFNRQQNTGL